MGTASLVGYIGKKDPSDLKALRVRHPAAVDVLSGREVFDGPASMPTPPPKTAGAREGMVALAESAIGKLEPDLRTIADELRRRLALVAKVQFGGGAVAVAAGTIGALVALLAKNFAWPKEAIALGTAIVASLGGLATLLAGHLERSPSGRKVNASEELATLVGMRSAVERAKARVRRDQAMPIPEGELVQILDELDAISVKVVELGLL
jgi:hypothetical protein